MKAIDDGGPAFPIQFNYSDGSVDTKYSGMSLRDWFAGTIAQGLLASTAEPGSSGYSFESLATNSYGYADAMLAQRNK